MLLSESAGRVPDHGGPGHDEAMSSRRGRAARLGVASVAATGCLATKGDVLTMRKDNVVARSEAAVADTARRRQMDSLGRALTAAMNGSFSTLGNTVSRLEALTRAQG